jgi:hypothetical protein
MYTPRSVYSAQWQTNRTYRWQCSHTPPSIFSAPRHMSDTYRQSKYYNYGYDNFSAIVYINIPIDLSVHYCKSTGHTTLHYKNKQQEVNNSHSVPSLRGFNKEWSCFENELKHVYAYMESRWMNVSESIESLRFSFEEKLGITRNDWSRIMIF